MKYFMKLTFQKNRGVNNIDDPPLEKQGSLNPLPPPSQPSVLEHLLEQLNINDFKQIVEIEDRLWIEKLSIR